MEREARHQDVERQDQGDRSRSDLEEVFPAHVLRYTSAMLECLMDDGVENAGIALYVTFIVAEDVASIDVSRTITEHCHKLSAR